MNYKTIKMVKWLRLLPIAFCQLFIACSILLIVSCNNKEQVHKHTKKEVTTYYTCSQYAMSNKEAFLCAFTWLSFASLREKLLSEKI
jgi:hypothetical protein